MSRALNRYVSRATLGLPRQERVEVAAELRTHLIDRVRQLEADGFSREEAEHLAVRGMGDVKVTNRQLLGHLFTTTLGWGVLAALVVGGGGWWVWHNVPLPLYASTTWRWSDDLSPADLAYLQQQEVAPRAPYVAGTLSVPAKTSWFYVALVPRTGPGLTMLTLTNLQYRQSADAGQRRTAVNGAHRARVLLSAVPWSGAPCPLKDNRPQLRLYAAINSAPPGPPLGFQMGGANGCTGLTLPDAQSLDSGYSAAWVRSVRSGTNLPLNRWTVLSTYVFSAGKRQASGRVSFSGSPNNTYDYLLAVMPADHPLHQTGNRREAEALLKGVGLTVMTSASAWNEDSFGLPRPTHPPSSF